MSPFFPSQKEVYFRREIDPYRSFISLVPAMISLARMAAEYQARSYRNFNVGASIFAIDFDGPRKRSGVLSGANTKLTRKDPKYCAEMNVIDQAEQAGFKEAIGIVLAATSDKQKIKDVTGKETETLHPCLDCLQKFEDSPLIHEGTFLVTSATDADHFQVHTVDQLEDVYTGFDDRLAPHAATQQMDLRNWAERELLYDTVSEIHGKRPTDIPQRHRLEVARVALTAVF